jgi:hypothetical protein
MTVLNGIENEIDIIHQTTSRENIKVRRYNCRSFIILLLAEFSTRFLVPFEHEILSSKELQQLFVSHFTQETY